MKKGAKYIYNGFGKNVGKVYMVQAINQTTLTLALDTPTGNKFADMPFPMPISDMQQALKDGDWLEHTPDTQA